ncbi:MAG: hypothetical protein ACTHLO_18045 [Pseudolabrys sp.]
MRMPLFAIAVLLSGGAAAFADDVPQPADATQAQPAAPNGPVKIIDATPAAPPASSDKSDQAQPEPPPAPPPPPVSTQAKTSKDPEPAGDGSRFSFVRVDDGFLRFDLTSGHVAYCNVRPEGWGCQAVPENRSALQREVDNLKGEVAPLKKQIDELREPPPPRPPAPIPPPSSAPPAPGDITRDAPGHDDIARARAMLQDVWDRLVATIVGFKNDVMRKS